MAEIDTLGLTSSRWWAKPGNKGKAGWFMGSVVSDRPLLTCQTCAPVTFETLVAQGLRWASA
jgi:hypothetical protein